MIALQSTFFYGESHFSVDLTMTAAAASAPSVVKILHPSLGIHPVAAQIQIEHLGLHNRFAT
jgi:hypothetical protein